MLRVLKHVSDRASDLGIAKMHHRQKFWGPPFTISDWFRPRYELNVCLLLKQRETQSRGYFFSFLERLVALVCPQIFFFRTLEKLGRTLEPCYGICYEKQHLLKKQMQKTAEDSQQKLP